MDIKNKLCSKEECVQKACAKIDIAFSSNLDTIYSDIWNTVQYKSPEIQASFVVNQEKAQVSAMINQQLSEMRKTFIDALRYVSKPKHMDERAYSDSQAVIMWQSVAIRIELPVLEYPKIEFMADMSEEKLIVEVLKKHLQEISQEFKQRGIPEERCEDVYKKMNKIICKYDLDAIHHLRPQKQMGKTARSMVLPSVPKEVLTKRKQTILYKLECWVDSIGKMLLAEEPFL